ncbi:hypothetical protein F5Y08DRAFT_352101 [Xylaria arbuscula]|nr:hypothetical protein F5Y08DRAFT_352101 [Xylaria arbuscula]
MLEPLLEAARKLDDASLLPGRPELLLPAISGDVSLAQIRDFITAIHDESDTTAVLSAVYVALKSDKLVPQPSDVDDDDGDPASILEDVALKVGQMILPICSGTNFDEDSTDYTLLATNGLLGLHILSILLDIKPEKSSLLPTRTIVSIIAFTSEDDPWTSSSSAELAQSVITEYFKNIPLQSSTSLTFTPQWSRDPRTDKKANDKKPKTEKAGFITEEILTNFLRPLFAKSRPTNITSSGRPAAYPEAPSRYTQGDDFGTNDITTQKPWKYAQQYAVTLFEWSVAQSDAELLQEHWPLYTPVLLTLLDEPQPTSLKLRSLTIFRVFWRACPDGLLSRTGLAEVFEQAVFPTVLNLPSITPEAESCDLLAAAYPALLDMAGLENLDDKRGAAAGGSADVGPPESAGFSEAQRKLLDKIIREGVMVGYHHAKQHVRLVDLLCQTLCRLMSGMGILSIKYLKDIIPMISEILVDPFGTKYPPILLSATRLLHAVLQTCWPRMPHYCNEIIKIVMLAWMNIGDEDSFPSDGQIKPELEKQLIKTVEMLSAIMTAAKLDISDRVSPLVAKEPQLRPLFISYEER